MLSKLHGFLASAAAAALLFSAADYAQAGAKPPAQTNKSACFFASSVDGWERIDDHTVRVSTGPSRRYDLTLMSTPIGLLNDDHIALKAGPSGWVCPGNGLGVSIVTSAPGAIRDHPVTNIALAPTPAEEKAMKAQTQAGDHEGHH